MNLDELELFRDLFIRSTGPVRGGQPVTLWRVILNMHDHVRRRPKPERMTPLACTLWNLFENDPFLAVVPEKLMAVDP